MLLDNNILIKDFLIIFFLIIDMFLFFNYFKKNIYNYYFLSYFNLKDNQLKISIEGKECKEFGQDLLNYSFIGGDLLKIFLKERTEELGEVASKEENKIFYLHINFIKIEKNQYFTIFILNYKFDFFIEK
jgi:hypothetical protein